MGSNPMPEIQKPPAEAGSFCICWDTGIRTPIKGFKGLCPTIRRYPNICIYNSEWFESQGFEAYSFRSGCMIVYFALLVNYRQPSKIISQIILAPIKGFKGLCPTGKRAREVIKISLEHFRASEARKLCLPLDDIPIFKYLKF